MPVPANRIADPARLAVLRATGLMHSAAEESFDRLTRLATRTTGAAAAAVVLIDECCQFFKSAVGLGDDLMATRQTPLDRSVCRHVLASGRPLVLGDLRDHPEVGVDLPLAYLGVPLTTRGGQVLGAFCVLDRAPRDWAAADLATMADLAACAGSEIELRLDIARRAELERELSEANGRFEAYMKNSPALAFAKDRAGRLKYINRRFVEHYDAADWMGKDDFEIWPTEVAEQLRRNDLEVWATGRAIEFVEETRDADGHPRRYLCLKFPYGTPDGTTLLGGMAIDITKLSRTEEALRRVEAESRTLAMAVARIDGAVAVADAGGRLLYASEAYARLFGACPAAGEAAGRDLIGHSLLVADDPGAIPSLRDRLARGERVEFALARRDAEDDPTWVDLEVQIVRDEAGEVDQYVAIARDVSERRRVIAALKASEAESRAARRAAEAASRAKSEFLANMSHEIRTPMNGILGMTELTLDTTLTPLQREYLGLVRASGESLLRIINDILDFSKIEAGRLVLEDVEFDLHDLIFETLRPLALRAHAAQLDLICHVEPDVPKLVRGDPHRLRQVLVNLVGNAVKFTPTGEVVVRVARAESPGVAVDALADASGDAGKVPIRFGVADTGVGVPPEKMATIFEPFEQADNSTSRTYGGSGLGLTISAEIVRLMGGRLWAESRPGRGSTFTCDVPLGRAGGQPRAAAPAELVGRRILVAVTNATQRRYLVADLIGLGLAPVELAEGRPVGEELARRDRPGPAYDLALVDDLWPGLDIPDLTRSAPVPLVFLATTGRSGPDVCPARGLPKPAPTAQLLATLRAAVAGASGADPAGPSPGATEAEAEAEAGSHPAPPPPAACPRPDATPGEPPRPLRVLLAEDQLVNRKVAARMLERLGHAVVAVPDGQEALDQLRSGPFDLVLMDIQMPVMDGIEAAGAIRRLFPGGGIPLVALTAHAMSGDRERCLEAGFDDYLSKPITSRSLEAVLGRIAPRIGGGAATGPAPIGAIAPQPRA